MNRIVKHGVQNNTAMMNPKTNHFDVDCFRLIMAYYFTEGVKILVSMESKSL